MCHFHQWCHLCRWHILDIGDDALQGPLWLYQKYENTKSQEDAWTNWTLNFLWWVMCRSSLGGQISPGLGNLTKLDSLILSNNNLTGPIPGDLFNAVTLSGLYLSGNVLTGQIPAQIFQVSMTLRVLDVSANNLTGSIPQGIGTKMTSLERLDLAQNLFTGSIPDDFGNLTKLKVSLLGPYPMLTLPFKIREFIQKWFYNYK